MLPVGAVMMVGFIFFATHFLRVRNPVQIAIFCIVPVIGISVNYIVMRRARNRLGAFSALAMRAGAATAVRAPGVGAVLSGGASEAAIEPSAEDKALLRTSRPREIKMAKRGKFSLAVAALVVVTFGTPLGVHLYGEWARTLSFATFQTKDWGVVGGFILLLLLPVGIWRSQVRECDLLENGEVALGKIVRQWKDDKNNSSVAYEFSDSSGQTHKGMGFDYSGKLYEGMSLPVFYDRENPKRQIAYCSTMHEIVT
jgi:xanthosine utilization system XapX-like protein